MVAFLLFMENMKRCSIHLSEQKTLHLLKAFMEDFQLCFFSPLSYIYISHGKD